MVQTCCLKKINGHPGHSNEYRASHGSTNKQKNDTPLPIFDAQIDRGSILKPSERKNSLFVISSTPVLACNWGLFGVYDSSCLCVRDDDGLAY